jgi:transposase
MAATAQDVMMFVGIDVSKDRLDVHIHPVAESFAVARDESGLAELVKRLQSHPLAIIAIEATGSLETTAVASLVAAGLPVVIVNPRQVHNYAKALGVNAKTDVIDACVIARFAEATRPEIRPMPDRDTLVLADYLARRRQIVQMIIAEKNRALRNVGNAPLQKSIGRILKALELELARLDDDIDKMVRGSPLWREKEDLLSSVPGVGKITSRTLLAEMPELGRLNNKQVSALAGVAPWTRQSGQWRGKSMIGGGRSVCRTALFMAAMAATRHNPQLKAFSERLLNAGKPKMVVLIAVARKLLTILNAIIKNRTPWQPKTV